MKYLLSAFLLAAVIGLSACQGPDPKASYYNPNPTDNTTSTAGAGTYGQNPYSSGGGTGTTLGR
jgi:hypothetical protein